MINRALIILVRNPKLGSVKTRLAADIGDERALTVYKALLEHTRSITQKVQSVRLVFYTDFINENDIWDGGACTKFLQTGSDFGERMLQTFEIALKDHQQAVIIGSDCYELTSEIINEAFNQLENFDVILGPAKDGGYYLLGLKQIYRELFKNKQWSTNTVLPDTLADVNRLGLTYFLLPTLSDIDVLEDLKSSKLLNNVSLNLPE